MISYQIVVSSSEQEKVSMGNSYEVYGYTYGEPHGISGEKQQFYYKELYRGESFLAALAVLMLKRRSYGCVKLEVRE
jgi:hypothetical protein